MEGHRTPKRWREGRARHSVRAVVVNPNALVGNGGRLQRPAGRGLPARAKRLGVLQSSGAFSREPLVPIGACTPFSWQIFRACFQNLKWQPRSGGKRVAHGRLPVRHGPVGLMVKQTFKPRMGRQNNVICLSPRSGAGFIGWLYPRLPRGLLPSAAPQLKLILKTRPNDNNDQLNKKQNRNENTKLKAEIWKVEIDF